VLFHALPPARFEMRHLPPDRHVECLAEDWVDLVPQRELHHLLPHDDATPSPSGRRFATVVASPPAPPSPPTSSPDAWLALAEESMRPPRADAPARRARRAARLVRACATALEPRDAPGGSRTEGTEGKDAFRVPPSSREKNGNAREGSFVSTPNDDDASFADASAKRRRHQKRSDARSIVFRLRPFFYLACVVFVAGLYRCPAAPRKGNELRASFFSPSPTLSSPSTSHHDDVGNCSKRTIESYLRSKLVLAEEREASLIENVAALSAAAEAFQRQSDFWYDAFAEATDTNAFAPSLSRRWGKGKRRLL
jgi:hypothetical protein